MVFTCTSGSLLVLTMSSCWLLVIIAFLQTGCCHYFGFGFTKLNWKVLWNNWNFIWLQNGVLKGSAFCGWYVRGREGWESLSVSMKHGRVVPGNKYLKNKIILLFFRCVQSVPACHGGIPFRRVVISFNILIYDTSLNMIHMWWVSFGWKKVSSFKTWKLIFLRIPVPLFANVQKVLWIEGSSKYFLQLPYIYLC